MLMVPMAIREHPEKVNVDHQQSVEREHNRQ
jgi:hypothetical protein